MQIYASLLYGPQEPFRIIDSLQSYSKARLQDVDFESQVQVSGLTDSEDFKAGFAEYLKLKANFAANFNDFAEQDHKIVQVAMSDFTTIILPDNVHGVLRLEVSRETLDSENVSPSNGVLPSLSNVSKLLHCKAVVYTHVLDTNTWNLRRIVRSEEDMVLQVLPNVCQSLRAAPPALVNDMLGALRRQIFSSIVKLARSNLSDPRACIFEPVCLFSLFAYVVYVS
jgi:hypothetical protein